MPALLSPEARTVAVKPLNLTVLAVAIVSGLTVATWLLPVGALVYLILIALGVRDPAVASEHRTRSSRLRLAQSSLGPLIADVEAAVAALERASAEAPPETQPTYERVLPQSRELAVQAHTLADKGVAIETYLDASRKTDLDA